MGDMADFALEQVWEMENLRFDYCMGDMTHEEAYDHGIIDEMGGEKYRPLFVKPAPAIQCKYCGSTAVSWKQFPDGKWRLQGSTGKVHVCTQYSKGKKLASQEGIGSDGFC